MSDKSNKYGYVGVDIPAQSFGSNKGVFNPAEINELVADNKWTQYGQLELIETQEVNQTVSALVFDNLQESTYNVHLLTISDGENNAGTENPSIRLSNNGGSSYIQTSSLYQYAQQYNQTSGTTAGELKSSGADAWVNFSSNISGTNSRWNGYIYFYNLGDSTKYSFYTSHTVATVYSSLGLQARFGSGVLVSAQTINAFKIDGDSFNGTLRNGVYSLYGIRYS